ncbi:hypothetical protein J6590_037434 [Homalodisca vitripennis]|nr:hypothetical protein J6590_037434 [Homalodisca vitripennis]
MSAIGALSSIGKTVTQVFRKTERTYHAGSESYPLVSQEHMITYRYSRITRRCEHAMWVAQTTVTNSRRKIKGGFEISMDDRLLSFVSKRIWSNDISFCQDPKLSRVT